MSWSGAVELVEIQTVAVAVQFQLNGVNGVVVLDTRGGGAAWLGVGMQLV